jgi:hypothetical protein
MFQTLRMKGDIAASLDLGLDRHMSRVDTDTQNITVLVDIHLLNSAVDYQLTTHVIYHSCILVRYYCAERFIGRFYLVDRDFMVQLHKFQTRNGPTIVSINLSDEPAEGECPCIPTFVKHHCCMAGVMMNELGI